MKRPSLTEIVGREPRVDVAGPDFAAHILREAIATGALVGGKPIRQDEVAQSLNTSKASLREALRQVQSEGLVELIKNRGFFVTEASESEMVEAFRIRVELESLAIDLAMPMMTKRDTDAAKKYIEKMSNINDPSWLCRLNLAFHISLYRPAQALHLMNMIEHAHYVSHRYVHARYSRFTELPLSQDEHWSILKACVARNASRAKSLIREHLLGALEELKVDLHPLFTDVDESEVSHRDGIDTLTGAVGRIRS